MRSLTYSALALLVSGGPDVTHAESVPDRGLVDPRIRTAAYRDEEVYRLQGFVGYGIELVFEEGEQFVGQAGGDLDAITFGAHENHVIPKPRAANVGTNFVVYTNRRAYRFDYAVADRWPDRLSDDVIYAVRFIYPHRLYVIQAYMPSGVSAAAGACGTDACRAAARFGVTGAGFRNAWSGAAAGRR